MNKFYKLILQWQGMLKSNYEQNSNVIIPTGFSNGSYSGYIRYANGNFDLNEETLDSKGTFHSSQNAVFRTSQPEENTLNT